MNTLATSLMTDPYGKVAECIQFTIDNPSDSFVLDDIMTIGHQYTFSMWLMSDANTSLTVAGDTFATNPTWNKFSITFTASGTDLLLNFGEAGNYYIYHPQLEIGNKATDWTPAPEDQTEEMETRFKIEADRIESQFDEVITSINEVGEVVRSVTTKIITQDGNGITIRTVPDNPDDKDNYCELNLDNDGLTISKNGEIRSKLIDDYFYTGNIFVETSKQARFGNFAFVPRSDGSLSFLKVGGN